MTDKPTIQRTGMKAHLDISDIANNSDITHISHISTTFAAAGIMQVNKVESPRSKFNDEKEQLKLISCNFKCDFFHMHFNMLMN